MESRPCLWLRWRLCPLRLDYITGFTWPPAFLQRTRRDERFPSGVACDVTARPLTSLGLPWQRDLS